VVPERVMEAYKGNDVTAPTILRWGLEGGETSNSWPGHFKPRKRDPLCHWFNLL